MVTLATSTTVQANVTHQETLVPAVSKSLWKTQPATPLKNSFLAEKLADVPRNPRPTAVVITPVYTTIYPRTASRRGRWRTAQGHAPT